MPAETEILASDSDESVAREGQLQAPRRWERLLVEAAVIGGRDRWRRRIEGLANELRLRLAEIGEGHETQVVTLDRALEDLSAFAGYALPLIDELSTFPIAADWGEWLDRLGALATRALRQPERVLAVLSELAPMGPVGPVTLTEILIVLEGLLLETSVPPEQQRYGEVFVGPIEAARGLSFHAVLVPGLAEKMFPRKIVEEPILLDAMRERIGGGLATNSSRLEEERLALALAAGAAEQRICFSYPRLDLDQARARVPSFYALEAVRAAEGRLPDFAEVTSGRLYFCTSTGGFAEQVVPLNKRSRDAADQVAEAVGEALAQPFLPAAPDDGQCNICDYRVVCGPHEERCTARKPQGNLGPLLVVRALP